MQKKGFTILLALLTLRPATFRLIRPVCRVWPGTFPVRRFTLAELKVSLGTALWLLRLCLDAIQEIILTKLTNSGDQEQWQTHSVASLKPGQKDCLGESDIIDCEIKGLPEMLGNAFMWPCSRVRHLDPTVLFLRGSFKVFVDRSQDASVSPVTLVFHFWNIKGHQQG